VHERDVGLGEVGDLRVEAVFVGEEAAPEGEVARPPAAYISAMSPPAQKARSPAPSITTSATPGSSRQASSAASMAGTSPR
jgi:hypothetical protein